MNAGDADLSPNHHLTEPGDVKFTICDQETKKKEVVVVVVVVVEEDKGQWKWQTSAQSLFASDNLIIEHRSTSALRP